MIIQPLLPLELIVSQTSRNFEFCNKNTARCIKYWCFFVFFCTLSLFLGAQNESSVNYTRQKSLRSRETHSRIKIEDKGTRVTLAFSPLDKNYSLTSSKPRCDWEKFMSPKYRCLSRAVLTVFVVFLTFLTLYVITIYGFKFTEDK